jgi:hypothetical protein
MGHSPGSAPLLREGLCGTGIDTASCVSIRLCKFLLDINGFLMSEFKIYVTWSPGVTGLWLTLLKKSDLKKITETPPSEEHHHQHWYLLPLKELVFQREA